MNKDDYLREGYRQLSDSNFYEKIDTDPRNIMASEVKQILSEMLDDELITQKNFDYFTGSEFSEGRFYLLPEIHKKGVPGRPICSTVSHPTCQVSKLVDAYIQRYVTQTDSYIKDTTDFIQKINEMPQLPENALLVTLDVTSQIYLTKRVLALCSTS